MFFRPWRHGTRFRARAYATGNRGFAQSDLRKQDDRQGSDQIRNQKYDQKNDQYDQPPFGRFIQLFHKFRTRYLFCAASNATFSFRTLTL